MASKSEIKKKNNVNCSGCNEEMSVTHGGIACPQGHHFCLNGCAAQFVQMILNEPQFYLPPRCPNCRAELNLNIIERIMRVDQIPQFHTAMFELVWAKQVVGPDDILCQCPFCNFAEIRRTDKTSLMFVFCGRDSCKKRSCIVCKREVIDDNLDSEDDDEDDCQNDSDINGDNNEYHYKRLKFHMKCSELALFKEKFDKIIESSTGVRCPGCGIIGRKDNACNHMSCLNCETQWCYFCGKKEGDLDTDNENIYHHFNDWQVNSNRCPMYLNNISEVDSSWPEDGEAVLDYFHRQRTLRLLNKFYHECGWKKWNEISNQFTAIKACGFTEEEILAVPSDRPMFYMKSNNMAD